MTPVGRLAGRKVETLEGLHASGECRGLQAAFLTHGAAQCGICTPGMLVSAAAPAGHAGADRAAGYGRARRRPLPLHGLSPRLSRPSWMRARRRSSNRRQRSVRQWDIVFGASTASARLTARTSSALTSHLKEPLTSGSCARRTTGPVSDSATWRDTSPLSPGVVAVMTASDIPGRNVFGVIPATADQPVFAEPDEEVRFRGEAVAMIVGEPDAMAGLDVTGFPVTWDELSPVMSLDDAQAPGAPRLHDGRDGNIFVPPQRSSRGCGRRVPGCGSNRGRGRLRDRLHRARVHRAGSRIRGSRRRPGGGAGDDAVTAHGSGRARGDPGSVRGRGPHQAHGGRRRVREQARPLGAALPRARRLEVGSARAPDLHATRVDDVYDEAASLTAPRPYRRHARRPPHRDGFHGRVQYRGVRIMGFDGREPCPGARRRSVRLRRVSCAHRGYPHERATVGRVPRVRGAAIDDRAGVPVR